MDLGSPTENHKSANNGGGKKRGRNTNKGMGREMRTRGDYKKVISNQVKN